MSRAHRIAYFNSWRASSAHVIASHCEAVRHVHQRRADLPPSTPRGAKRGGRGV